MELSNQNYVKSLRTAVGLAVGALVFEAAACGAPEPVQQPSPSQQSVGIGTPSQSPNTTEATPIQTVAQPWQPGDFQDGVQLYWHTVGSKAEIVRQADETLDYIVSLGANSVGISYPIDVDGATPTKVYAGAETPTPDQLALVVKEAEARKLRVMLRPIIDETNIVAENPSAWRGSININNTKQAWYESYESFLKPYISMAEQTGVDEFVLGAELNSLQPDIDDWNSLKSMAAQIFTRVLSYGYNWNDETPMPFQQVGIDMYPPVNLGDSASIPALSEALTSWLESQKISGKQLTVQEAGIPAEQGAYAHPWQWGNNVKNIDTDVQEKWFAACYQAARSAGAAGIYYWMVDSNLDLSNYDSNTAPAGNFVDRPAQTAIQHVFESGTGTP